jgi:hypothetical protein
VPARGEGYFGVPNFSKLGPLIDKAWGLSTFRVAKIWRTTSKTLEPRIQWKPESDISVSVIYPEEA